MNTKAERQAENVINLVRGSDNSRKKMALSLLNEDVIKALASKYSIEYTDKASVINSLLLRM